MMTPISKVFVRYSGMIPAIRPRSRFRSYLAAGRYECDGYVERAGNRYVRLRDSGDKIYLVSERVLLRTPGHTRRVYRGNPQPHPGATADAVAEIHVITREERAEGQRQLWAAMPRLPRHHLGTYVQFGSQDSWRMHHSIERSGGKWIIHIDGPEDERESISADDLPGLIEGVAHLGYDTDDLITDLRENGEPQLALLAQQIEDSVPPPTLLHQAQYADVDEEAPGE